MLRAGRALHLDLRPRPRRPSRNAASARTCRPPSAALSGPSASGADRRASSFDRSAPAGSSMAVDLAHAHHVAVHAHAVHLDPLRRRRAAADSSRSAVAAALCSAQVGAAGRLARPRSARVRRLIDLQCRAAQADWASTHAARPVGRSQDERLQEIRCFLRMANHSNARPIIATHDASRPTTRQQRPGAARASARRRRRPTRRPSSARCGPRAWPSTSASPRRASSSRSSSARPRSAARRWTMCCCSARRGWARPRCRHIIAAELGVNLRQTSGPVLEKPKDLAAILTNLERNDVLFIDEIHRLSPGGRGNPLSGAGGLPDRHHDRRGPGGAHRSSSTCSPSRWSARPRAPAC